jgi:membrane protease YdiL (CAAX protease family)
MLGLMPLLLRMVRRGSEKPAATPASRLPAGLHLPLPVTPRECWLFGLVALSTGICEEVVFRGCPLNALHSVHTEYWTLVALAAIFGAIFTRESRESL